MTSSGPIRVIGVWDDLGDDERGRALDRGLDWTQAGVRIRLEP